MMAYPSRAGIILINGCWALSGILAGVILGAWLCSRPTPPAGQWQQAKQDKRIANTGTEKVKPQDCTVVVHKLAAKKKLDLPPEIQNDTTQHVSSAVIIPSDERPQSVVTLFDTTTGQTRMLTQRLAYPWIAAEHRGQLWLGYGLADGGQRVGRIHLREDLLQISALHFGGQASLDSGGRWFAGVGVGVRW